MNDDYLSEYNSPDLFENDGISTYSSDDEPSGGSIFILISAVIIAAAIYNVVLYANTYLTKS
ncbi:MAG: hypothetical protein IJE14_07635 [Clostridia bacterium]|nr:hypothetical protein [Clostridia bacterium]MBQ3602732.1 hypothetical protein [Clostridia bacterium]MBQ6873563.1 hypothetical protein [Clostridia bacterium]